MKGPYHMSLLRRSSCQGCLEPIFDGQAQVPLLAQDQSQLERTHLKNVKIIFFCLYCQANLYKQY